MELVETYQGTNREACAARILWMCVYQLTSEDETEWETRQEMWGCLEFIAEKKVGHLAILL